VGNRLRVLMNRICMEAGQGKAGVSTQIHNGGHPACLLGVAVASPAPDDGS
jgi:hypothetical protein